METVVRIVGFGDSVVSEVLDSANNGSIDRIEIPNLSDFSHGEIDWLSLIHISEPTRPY